MTAAEKEKRDRKDWDEFVVQVNEISKVLAGAVLFPLIIGVAVLYGVRSGILAGIDKLREMLHFYWGDK